MRVEILRTRRRFLRVRATILILRRLRKQRRRTSKMNMQAMRLALPARSPLRDRRGASPRSPHSSKGYSLDTWVQDYLTPWLGERYRTNIHVQTLAAALRPVEEYLDPDDPATHLKDLLRTFAEERRPNGVGGYVKVFPTWVEENYQTWDEWLSEEPQRVAQELFGEALESGALQRRGAFYVVADDPDDRRTREDWERILCMPDNATTMRREIAGRAQHASRQSRPTTDN